MKHLPKLLIIPLAFGLAVAVWGHFRAVAADASGTNTGANASSVTLTTRTFATLPATTTGTIAYISDGLAGNCGDASCTTFGTTVTGGTGALKLMVWYNGANWTLVGK